MAELAVDEGENRSRNERASTAPRGQLLRRDEDGAEVLDEVGGEPVESEAQVNEDDEGLSFGEESSAVSLARCSC